MHILTPRFAGQLGALLLLAALSIHRLMLAFSLHPFAQPLRAPQSAKTLLERPEVKRIASTGAEDALEHGGTHVLQACYSQQAGFVFCGYFSDWQLN